MAEAFRRVTTEELASVFRETGEAEQASRFEVSRLRWRPRGEIFDARQTGDGHRLQLHGAPPHRRELITSLLGCESTRDPAVPAVHAGRLSARHDIGRRGSTFTIEFPVPVGKGARVTT
jgi:hypothetical protein